MPEQTPNNPTEGQRAAPAVQTASRDTLAERERVREITDLCQRHGLTDMASDLIADGTPIDAARAAVLDSDEPQLFEFTLEVLQAYEGAHILYQDDDIYAKDLPMPELNIKTYYERMHLAEGKTIKYVRFKLED